MYCSSALYLCVLVEKKYLTTYSVLNVARINVLMFACCESLDKTCEKPFGV